jgi:multidrug efflux pump subunit AcrB
MGFAGRIAQRFLQSRLTPLITIAALAAGALAIIATPREEEPQISVPMIDVMAMLPGGSPLDVEHQLTRRLEQRLWEIPGVEHVYAVAGTGYTLVTARFRVGQDQDQSVARVHAKLFADLDRPWPGGPPLVKPHAIDDVPILTLTLSSRRYGSNELRQVATRLEEEIRTLTDVAQTSVIGGQPRQVRIDLQPARLAAAGLTPAEVAAAVGASQAEREGSGFALGGTAYRVLIGAGLRGAAEVGRIVVGLREGRPVYLGDVAEVRDAYGERTNYVSHAAPATEPVNAVTITVAKRPGANATTVARAALERVDQARHRLVPADVELTETRNYGESAREKAAELIRHLVIATVSVALLIGIFLGRREAVVVLVAVPVTLALTLFSYYALGYTLNRITLFALIFSIGILVDDAIVVVENVYRHLTLEPGDPVGATIRGVDEVGNPTILATFTVIAAILPMAFVRGLMGPYMRPIPVGASVAMLASLAVAFIITPALAYRFLRHQGDGTVAHAAAADSSRFARLYRGLMTRLMDEPAARRLFLILTLLLLLGSMSLVLTGLVQVKMLPFDNKSEFQVVLDTPEGTTLERSAALAAEIAAYLRTVPEVRSTQVYAGTAAPFNFNGLVRHYFLRQGPTVADVQVNLVDRHQRDRQSHAIAVAVRPVVDSIARRYGASAKIAEIPPGPPVLSTLVAEVYAGNDSTRMAAARRVRQVFEATPGVVDIDWSIEAPQRQYRLRVDRARAAAAGVNVDQVVQSVSLAEAGAQLGFLRGVASPEGAGIVGRTPLADRSTLESFLALPIATRFGAQPLARFVTVDSTVPEPARYRRDLRPLIYVTADVAGAIESPVYAIRRMNQAFDSAGSMAIARYNAVQPARLDETAIKWDGEWQVTIEVFRDLGLAFAAVLLLIYVLVVWWFESFTLPLVIMAPIPLTLIGILPGHALSGAFFTATSMIGMIALAGIIVRNSILLVDFIQLRQRDGAALREAVIEAGTVRFRPIALTAAAVVVGGLVMVLDPIFQGLAVSLIAGAVVATLLTMLVVPMLYWELQRRSARQPEETHV